MNIHYLYDCYLLKFCSRVDQWMWGERLESSIDSPKVYHSNSLLYNVKHPAIPRDQHPTLKSLPNPIRLYQRLNDTLCCQTVCKMSVSLWNSAHFRPPEHRRSVPWSPSTECSQHTRSHTYSDARKMRERFYSMSIVCLLPVFRTFGKSVCIVYWKEIKFIHL